MGNVALALDLSGDGIRDHLFAGTLYRFEPTSYCAALQLLQVNERFETLVALGNLTGEEQLLDLRGCFTTIADLAHESLIPHPPVNPFLDGEVAEFQGLLGFMLDTGNEMPVPESETDDAPGTPNAARQYMAYRAVFGEPTTWREFVAGHAYLRHQRADTDLRLHVAVLMAIACALSGKDASERWTQAMGREVSR